MTSREPVADLAVVGLGPAGRALAHRAAAAGLDVVAVDPHPDRRWTPTYAAWCDELPGWLDGPAVVAARVERPRVWTTREQVLPRPYCVLDNDALLAALDLGSARVLAGSAAEVEPGRVILRDGNRLCARQVIDARGAKPAPVLAEQTAYGVVVSGEAASPVLGDGEAWFMDWRADNGAPPDETPSFLYAVPLGRDRVLLEETCLVGRPGLSQEVLRTRLEARLRSRGVPVAAHAERERVRFPVQVPRAAAATATFGARAGIMHPGTGYSVAASLSAVDGVVGAIVAGNDPRAALWPRAALAVRALREVGLRALLRLPPQLTAEFFEAFFDLPTVRQRAYLSERADPAAVSLAMAAVFRRAPNPVRRTLARAVLPTVSPTHGSLPRPR
ncbi:lycopene cyclase family protein [Rhodococcus maanshanensis]|uniref:Lycopene beta-cyclase n=1 Tax=Rhodococcus maanshanensis TaxID=183556 RepID=A0A1H7Q2B6_9NOCA|nr:lycopene cyclase family protein [Rhodococcus maanshanensis]SEL41858.1 lycopene beta-cyclase [Rhodococcus maanshanensis]